ncbi:MAG: rhomboid family intramembrane serine protease [Candidatus Omnitrophica bacterium]|nr:rhomboid family intramembrane serine protease [Candidatus Omnitrophota bacterium]
MIPLHDENPTERFSFVTIVLVIVNSIVFLYELSLGSSLEITIRRYTLIPYNFINYFDFSQLRTLFSSLFLHGSLLHLLGNMLYLWIFGNNIEDVLGHFKFILFYFLCGISASLAHILTNPHSTIPTLGASGAVSGVLGAYFILFPQARVVTIIPIFYFIRIVKIPAFFFLGFWIAVQFLSGIISSGMDSDLGGGVAWFAHLGGFFAGVLLLPLFYQRGRRRY